MFIVAETTALTVPLVQMIQQVLRTAWPVWLFVAVAFFLKNILPAILNRQKQAKWFEAQTTLKAIQNLKPKQFETFCAVLFGKLGFSAKTTSYTKDGGVDVIAVKDGQTHFIQCKKYVTRKVSLSDVRDFYGAMADAGCRRGFFVTTGFFTLDAERFAAGKPIELINGERLMEYVKESRVNLRALPETIQPTAALTVPTTHSETAKTCPECGAELVRRTAKRGANAGAEFLGCGAFPKCRFTKALS